MAAQSAPSRGLLRSPSFDLAFTVGLLALALGLGALASIDAWWFAWVLIAELWLFAYPHIASTYTRIAFDREAVRRHRFLLFGLPPLVLAGTGGIVAIGGAGALGTLYYYWQAWHYSRQSFGIARAYRRAAGAGGPDLLADGVVFAFPLWGLCHRGFQHPGSFYDLPLYGPEVPFFVDAAMGAIALSSLAVWLVRTVRARAPGSLWPSLFVLSHVVITAVSYVVVSDVTKGWIVINIWHNAQYLLFVWAQNARRFERGVEPERAFLSKLCQPESVLRYAAVCAVLGWGFYFALGRVSARITWPLIPMVLVTHMAVNFHHYIVDAVIWRSPKRALRASLDESKVAP